MDVDSSSIELRKPPFTSRTLNTILGTHNLGFRDFWRKTVLDLGCGGSNLQRELEENGIETHVIGVDIVSGSYLHVSVADRSSYIMSNLGALPIASESVDMAIATYSLPHWATTTEEVDQFFGEAMRVVKVGGILSVSPLHADCSTFGGEWDIDDHIEGHVQAIGQSPNWVVDSDIYQRRALTALRVS